MARKNANTSAGVWLGLLLVLVAHTLAGSSNVKEELKRKEVPDNEDVDYEIGMPEKQGSPPKMRDLDETPKISNKFHKPIRDEAKDINDEKRTNRHSDDVTELDGQSVSFLKTDSGKANIDVITTTPRDNEPIPTITTLNGGLGTTESMKGYNSGVEKSVEEVNKTEEIRNQYQEFNTTEEQDNIEEHTVSELAEGTTPSNNHDLGNGGTISLANDINVNNGSNILIDSNGTGLGNEPKHQVERFNVTDLTTLRIIEQTGRGLGDDNTTPYFSSSSRPKGRTISNTGDNDLSMKKPNNHFNHSDTDQHTSVTIRRIVPKKPPSTSKPYPYIHSEMNVTVHDPATENTNTTEESTDGISTYENIINRQTSGENIVEPSVLGENSIQQFKPIHNKRSGNLTRINSTLENSATSTAWSFPADEDFDLKNFTGVTEESHTTFMDNGNRSHINNDVPQGNLNESFTTTRNPVILSEVPENNIENGFGTINNTFNLTASTPISKKLTERSEVTAEEEGGAFETQVSNSTENIRSILNDSSTSNEVQIGNEGGSAESVILEKNLSTTTEIYTTIAVNIDQKLNSEIEIGVSLPVTISTTTESSEESSTDLPHTSESSDMELIRDTNVTEIEINSEVNETMKSTTESNIVQTTNIEYEFMELTTQGTNVTVSQEKFNATTDFLNVTSEMTESQEILTTDDYMGQNDSWVSRKLETDEPENSGVSTTLVFETTTTSNNEGEPTTMEETSNTTNSPVSESGFTTVTDDVFTDTTLSSTSFDGNSSSGDIEHTTIGQTSGPEETTMVISTQKIIPEEETTTVSNIEFIPTSESPGTRTTSTIFTQSTTLQIQTTTELLPEFSISNDEVTLFVRVIIEGSWTEICPVLNNLRQSLADLLTEGTGSKFHSRNIILHQTQCSADATPASTLTQVALYVVDGNGEFDYIMTELLPSLYKASPFEFSLPIHNVEKLAQTESTNNAIAVIAVSSVAFICLVLLAGLLFIMRKRQTRFNYGERCRPVSLDAFRLDSVSAYNSVRRKGLTRASKRSYGNPAFEDSSVTPTHPLNFAGLSSFCNESNAINEEFEGIPQVTARMDELPAGSEVKNRYANVAPLPETRVLLQKINNEPLTEYINASYVRGPKNATKYYIACQAPMESTVSDFWRMIWEQQSKVIIMLTDIVENGVEKCVEYIPPSEVTDCHRLYGDYQVTLKKREAKEKYAISTLHLKNLENNTYREVSHIWYLWPTNGVPSNGTGLIAILLEARALQRGAPGPIVIHCSPGTGRTGTLIALDLGIRQYEITRTVDVPRVVYTIRRDRAGAVQTKEQYAFIYKALNLYAAKLAGGALESM